MENLDEDLCADTVTHRQRKQSESQCAQHHLQRAQTKGILCQCLHLTIDNSEIEDTCCMLGIDMLAVAGGHSCLQSIQTQLKPHLKQKEKDS